MRFFATFFVFIIGLSVSGQSKESSEKLSDDLKEISGLALFQDTLLISLNDSGNKPILYFINFKGKVLHSCKLTNAKNNDWEDLTTDPKGFVYIADCGNNENKRKDLVILKVDAQLAFTNDSVKAEKLNFTYEDQIAFAPKEAEKNFDCESIYWNNDSIFMVTKSYAKPWTGISNIYGIATSGKQQVAVKRDSLMIGKTGWRLDAVTSADYKDNHLYVLTYNRMIDFERINGTYIKQREYIFKDYNQKEAILALSANQFFVAAEKHKLLGGPYLYTIRMK
ncbi:MAG: hypothetical protein E6Q38_04470 [Crocinitomicaceae bacterium]|nr:MAG: hypothetical protein E6Q38_04470 [Crocinitomicaceae bacterium]